MKIQEQHFAAHVALPCSMFWGKQPLLKLDGVAVSIESSSLVLDLGEIDSAKLPPVGSEVKLVISLPVKYRVAKAKNLTIRARVLTEMVTASGSKRFQLTFRKPLFQDRPSEQTQLVPAGGAAKWRM
jgi:hypothetical protein